MYATRAVRQAAHAAERTPLIKFIGRRSIPSQVDHTPHPHPASPSGALPQGFTGNGNSHSSFSSYRDHAQQHGPLRKTIGGQTGAHLGPVVPPSGVAFDRNELPERFRRHSLTLAEIEAVESGGAALFG
ncbi:hypothetical protein MGN70_012513 [Eutypa lata]|uniref:Putative ribosomal protein ymr-31 protein n=1 Tax=Eutypa lata (strain UCR-EL1) TaxID=1287681 RepID=M7TSE5_EUTLA|nr:putative ribosomal protein ymr-31 protein [Eutypa lata UCREL1]KAI1245621.1 hypothetical protein MGN70_012513 [Eutypa lata]